LRRMVEGEEQRVQTGTQVGTLVEECRDVNNCKAKEARAEYVVRSRSGRVGISTECCA
jgi:hypothetical protein